MFHSFRDVNNYYMAVALFHMGQIGSGLIGNILFPLPKASVFPKKTPFGSGFPSISSDIIELVFSFSAVVALLGDSICQKLCEIGFCLSVV